MVNVLFHPAAEAEIASLPDEEKVAMVHAVEKLEVMGLRLCFPHQSGVSGTRGLRELRPRGGRSQWRAFYRQIDDVIVIGGVGPEAKVDRRRFDRAVKAAQRRLDMLDTKGIGWGGGK